VLISAVDPVTHEVAAFEELVGSHGGLGGWQTDAMLVHPSEWPIGADEINGSDAVHRLLVEWLEMLGLRAPDRAGPAVEAARALEAGEPLRLTKLTTTDGAAARLSRSRDS
jgi:hypothetical protein